MKSHRQILKSSAITGGASALNIAIGIVKIKVLAVLLGPSGVGLMGLYQNIMSIGSTVSGCGMSSSGVKQLAASADDAATLAVVRRTLLLAHIVLGIFGMTVLLLERNTIANWVFGDLEHAREIGWLGLGVLLTLIAGSQTALLQGLRRIRDLAWVKLTGALLSAAVGIALVYFLGQSGVLWFVLAVPAISVLVASYFAARLPRPQSQLEWQAIIRQWQAMLRLGIPFMTAVLLTLSTQLAIRSLILRDIGLEANGWFQAAWAISINYIGFVLGAMALDYYPRLTEAINDRSRARRLVGEQTEMSLLLAGPVLLAMITFAPLVINLLYTASFAPAADILRWQMLGNMLKIASWPMGFILLSMGRGGIYILTESLWNATYIGTILTGIGGAGLIIAGVGFWLAYLAYFLLMALVAMRLLGYTLSRQNALFLLILLCAGGTIIYLATLSVESSLIVGTLVTVAVGLYSLRELNRLVDLTMWVRRRFSGQSRR